MTQSNFRLIGNKHYPRITHVIGCVINKGIGFNKWLMGKTEDEVKDILEDTSDSGIRIHAGSVALAKDRRIRVSDYAKNESEYLKLKGFANFMADHKPEFLDFEIVVHDNKSCGQYDIRCIIDNQPCIIDIKTGSYIYPSYDIQASFYCHAFTYNFSNVTDGKVTQYQPLVLHLKDSTKKGYFLKADINLKDGIRAYKATYDLYKFLGYPLEPKEEEVIPEYIEL